MDKQIGCLTAVLVLLTAINAQATIVELSLDCAGTYSLNDTWSTEFDLGVEFTDIFHEYIDWESEITDGKAIYCSEPAHPVSGFSPIEYIYIKPAMPTFNNPITVHVGGWHTSGGVSNINSIFVQNGDNLSLDIYYDYGNLAIMTKWTYSRDIGTLAAGTYNLVVTNMKNYYTINSKYMTFEVVPEPSTVLLLALGAWRFRQVRLG